MNHKAICFFKLRNLGAFEFEIPDLNKPVIHKCVYLCILRTPDIDCGRECEKNFEEYESNNDKGKELLGHLLNPGWLVLQGYPRVVDHRRDRENLE